MLTQILASTLRVSTPLILAAMGGLICERAGVINLALEGMMLYGAFAAGVATLWTHSPWLGAMGGMAAGAVIAALYALCVQSLRANQIIAGMAINLLALGLTPFLCKAIFGVTGTTPAIPLNERWQVAPIFLAWTAVAACWLFFKFTRPGLRLTFAGENPEALHAAGLSVRRIRWAAILASGMLSGLAGASLSIYLASAFSRNMTAGRGFIAVAAVIFGKWKPIPAALACAMFGLVEALQIRLQSAASTGSLQVPLQLVQALPYLVTIIVLAGFAGKSRAPKYLGKINY